MSTTAAVFAWIGLVLGLGIAVVVLVLFHNVLRVALEIKRYAADVLDAGVGIATNLDGVDEAVRTRELATAVPPLAVAYLQKLGKVPG
ncbi:MAG: hypothetical protein H0V40_05395 [Actinobacteria bacterium]|nr:hypothetical protein [Actinomycetota bacterium]